MGEPHRFATLKCAIRALRREILEFRFEYPLEIVPAAGPRDSLDYYLYSDKLSWEAMRLDPQGIPRTWCRLAGAAYWPGYIAWYGLVNLGHHLRRRDAASLGIFLNQIDWLERHAVLRDDGAVVWPMNFDYPEGSVVLKAPWVSAHIQGLVISALVRGWRLTRRPHLIDLLARSAKVFELEVDQGGIRLPSDGHILYTETPGGPPPGIQDGFMTSLLGLYDLFVETGDPTVGQLFNQGIDGLKSMLPRWDYRQRWSWYGCRAYLCPPQYHCLNRVLLTVLARLSNEPSLAQYAQRWDPDRLTTTARAEVYFGFLLTKNVSRLKHRTWRQQSQNLRRSQRSISSSGGILTAPIASVPSNPPPRSGG